ncbi:S1 family peptidase [Nocardia arthritidis]|uniref:Serine protease n=1 Tax=Nocardia arthritidis TaxID=228602 RepID=A0A6G9YCA7_9NOCA|nr:S1 family peptidase [Nocardia arthritidis]QIS10794.1 hypothetical protein F5544_14545 [Nocardia arthritidis]
MARTFRWVTAVTASFAGLAVVGAGAAQADPSAVLGGSSGIIFDTDAACSLTTIGHDRAGRLVGLTAGHCAPVGANLIAERTREAGVVGRVVYSDNGDGIDYAVIEFDPDRVIPVRTVGPTTIGGIGAAPGFGGTVCANGRSSGFGCGVVWGVLDGTTINQACSRPGDSGGPVTVGDRLVGMNQGRLTGLGPIGFDVPCTIAAIPYHSPAFFASIDQILGDIDARGEVGAGFQPI